MTLTLDLFNYDLPADLIAHTPAKPADTSRLMLVNRQTQTISHYKFHQLDRLIPPNSLFVFNITKVRPVRLITAKPSGGKLEILITDFNPHRQTFTAWVKPGLKNIASIHLGPHRQIQAKLTSINQKDHYFKITAGRLTYQFLNQHGRTPLPPYIKPSAPEKTLRHWYQSVFAKTGFSIAAPTASLHFTKRLLKKLSNRGHQFAYLQLDVGLGTFAPVKSRDISKHTMHAETYSLSPKTADLLNQAKAKKQPIIAVGTTVARTLESAFNPRQGFQPASQASTNLFIYPPRKLKAFDILITNFHLPKSTLLMLVSAFTSWPNTSQRFTCFSANLIGQAYQQAIKQKYRFFSFGDAMIIV
ncbi:MAG: tRNA preQ1(34) S-adenosylmethionine ribosyltransferase-isomerase QueA [bacterium]|nr:tRNA preQ1(34) S-adenosylmethionine ribosyltransferase-isomerase QueA [bacterium]